MISLSTSKQSAFDAQVDAAFVKLEAEMSLKFAAFTHKVFRSIVLTSPQWSGNLTSNWNYSIKAPDESYSEIAEKELSQVRNYDPFEVGSNPATGRVLAKVAAAAVPSWRDTVYITNATPNESTGYLVDSIIAGKVNLRPVNLVPAQGAIFEFTMGKFKDEIL